MVFDIFFSFISSLMNIVWFVVFGVVVLFHLNYKLWKFYYLLGWDLWKRIYFPREFLEFGVTCFAGRQGSGKTVSLVWYLERIRKKYPKALIVTNFQYAGAHHRLTSWRDLMTIRNGKDGVVFAIDEFQNYFDNSEWKKFPKWLLKQITQQRKQRVKIVVTSQVFSRVVKQLREQCFEVVQCKSIGWKWSKRWTFCKAIDADAYNDYIDSPDTEKTLKAKRYWRASFIQTDALRGLFDTDEVITADDVGVV